MDQEAIERRGEWSLEWVRAIGGPMDTHISRRDFFKACASGVGGSSLALLGFSPQAVLAETRAFKLAKTTETRNTCPYCSVGCGIIMYSFGDKAKNAVSKIIH